MENSVSETLNSTSRQWSVLQIGSKSLCGFSFSKFSTNNVNGFFVIVFDSLEISTFWKVYYCYMASQHAHCMQNADAYNFFFCIVDYELASKNHRTTLELPSEKLVEFFTGQKWIFPLKISSVNVTKSAVSCGFGHIYWRNP